MSGGRKRRLSKKESKEILERECPVCEYAQKCNTIRDAPPNSYVKLCRVRSSEEESVWLYIQSRKKREVKVGDRYGFLVVQKRAHRAQKSWWWICKCDCGNICVVRGGELLRGDTKSCGCFFKNRREGRKRLKNVQKAGGGEDRTMPELYKEVLIRVLSSQVNEYSSQIGKSVWGYVTQVVDGKEKRVLSVLKCDECQGVIRYQKDGIKACENCGLVLERNVVWEGEA